MKIYLQFILITLPPINNEEAVNQSKTLNFWTILETPLF